MPNPFMIVGARSRRVIPYADARKCLVARPHRSALDSLRLFTNSLIDESALRELSDSAELDIELLARRARRTADESFID